MALLIITVPTLNVSLCVDRDEQGGEKVYILEFHTLVVPVKKHVLFTIHMWRDFQKSLSIHQQQNLIFSIHLPLKMKDYVISGFRNIKTCEFLALTEKDISHLDSVSMYKGCA